MLSKLKIYKGGPSMTFIYEGKSKKVFPIPNNPNQVQILFKDEVTAFNGEKKALIEGKGAVNAAFTHIIFKYLEDHGIKTAGYKLVDVDLIEMEKVDIIPIEFVFRYRAAGGLSKTLKIPRGKVFQHPIVEVFYKSDALNDPLLSIDTVSAMGILTPEEIAFLKSTTLKVAHLSSQLLLQAGILLVDGKLEFGRNKEGQLVLADEFSPDTCRLWEIPTMRILDKDRFRMGLGEEAQAYQRALMLLQDAEKFYSKLINP